MGTATTYVAFFSCLSAVLAAYLGDVLVYLGFAFINVIAVAAYLFAAATNVGA